MWSLSWRWFWRELRAGSLSVVLLALALSAFAIAATGLLAERVQRALTQQAAGLVGGDVVLRADHPVPNQLIENMRAVPLLIAQSAELPSSIRLPSGAFKLIEAKAVSANFPLRGRFVIKDAQGQRNVANGPAPGTVWLAERLRAEAQFALGDSIKIGARAFTITAWILEEPDAAFDYFALAPRVLLHWDDLAATELVQPGARVSWRAIGALPPGANTRALDRFIASTRPQLGPGERLETVADTRSEIRDGLQRGSSFLRLALLVALLLAGAALGLSAWRYYQRQLDSFAVLRALGCTQPQLGTLLVVQLLLLASMAAGIGVLFALGSDALLAQALQRWLEVSLPAPGVTPLWQGFMVALLLLLGFAGPSFWRLRSVPALHVLQRVEGGDGAHAAPLLILPPLLIFSLLTLWLAQSWRLAGVVLAALAVALLLYGLGAWLLLRLTARARAHTSGAVRLGMAALGRRPKASVLQVLALSSGLCALLTLTMLRGDLLDQWRAELPPDTPNRFLINVQDDQVPAVRALLEKNDLRQAKIWPMVRARFVARNDAPVRYEDFEGPRARRLAEREFNLSTAENLSASNRLVQGRFWQADSQAMELSAEVEFAERLGWRLGDRIRFDLGGVPLEATLTSLREVRWESFEPNFFVLLSPAALAQQRASWIASLHLPPDKAGFADELYRNFPNVSLLDLDAIIRQVRSTVDQVSRAIELLFWFTLIAGLLVLWAAVDATQPERRHEAAVLRVTGASNAQLQRAHIAEFGALGVCTALLAGISATGIAWALAAFVFDFYFLPDVLLLLGAGALTIAIVLGFGLWGARSVRRMPPSESLRQLSV
jgi:putative ABC transport system permease protein